MSVPLPGLLSFVPLLTVGAALLLAWHAWRRRETPCGPPIAAVAVGTALWAAAHALGLASGDLASAVLWTKVEWVAVLLVPAAWLRFALTYTGADRWTVGRTAAAVYAPVALLSATIWVDPFGLFLTPADALRASGGLALRGVEYGPLYWLSLAYASLSLFVVAALLVHSTVSAPRGDRWRNATLGVAAALPWTAAAVDAAGYGGALGPSLVPLALAGSCLVLGWTVVAGDLFDALPLTLIAGRDAVFSELADGVVVVDAENRVVECNPAARDLLPEGAPVRGEPIPELFPALDAVLADDRAETVEENVVLADDGQARYFEVRATPIERDGVRPMGHLVTLHDTDDRILREQRLDVLNRILRHNVRNQMTVVLGNNRNVLEAVTDDALVERAESVDRAGRRLLEWAERAQQVERTVGRGTTEVGRMDLVETVETVGDRLAEAHPYASIHTYHDGPAWIVADRSVGEAIEELITNAVVHSDRPRPRIRLTVESDDETVELRVADDGPGIPPSERRALARGRETPLDHSNGLGLWLVNWLVRLSGGTVDFPENETRGSVVRLRFPAAPPEKPGWRDRYRQYL